MFGAPMNESASARSVARSSAALNADARRRAAADEEEEEVEEAAAAVEEEDEEDEEVSSSKVMTRTACRAKTMTN